MTVAGKLAPPPLGVPVLPRPRLLELLDQAVERRVTALTAPAGYGKTVACATWSRSRARRYDIAWLTVDAADNDPRRFWCHLIAALDRCDPRPPSPAAATERRGPVGEGRASDQLGPASREVTGREGTGREGMNRGSGNREADRLVERLLAARHAGDRQTVLIVDEVQELHDPEVVQGLAALLRQAPRRLRIVLAGRGLPALGLARLRVSGDLAELGTAELAWQEAEAAEYFRAAGLPLTAGQLAELLCRTGGWSTGLRLARLWLAPDSGSGAVSSPASRPGAGALSPTEATTKARSGARSGAGGGPLRRIADFRGDEPLVADYFREEVLRRLRPELRRFLVQISVANPVRGDLADALTGGTGGGRTLSLLHTRHCFLDRLDEQGTWHVFHPLFREFLQAELRRELPAEVAPLLRRAAHWYRGHGRALDALRATIDGADWEHATDLLAAEDVRIMLRAADGELADLVRRLPPHAAATPEAALAQAWDRLASGDPEAAGPYLAAAVERGAAATAVRQIAAALDIVRAWRTRGGRERVRAARQDIASGTSPRDRRATGCLLFVLGLGHAGHAEFVTAGQALRRAVRELDAGGFPALADYARAWAALVDAVQGDLAGASRAAHRIRRVAADGLLDPRGVADLALAWVHLERAEPVEAYRLVEHVPPAHHGRAASGPQRPGGLLGELPIDELAALTRSRILLGQGDLPLPRPFRAEPTTFPGMSEQLVRTVRLLDLTRLPASDVSALRVALACPPARAADAVALGRLRLMDGDAAGALAAVADCLTGTAGELRLLDRIAALLVAAAAQRRAGAPERAARLLEQALQLAEPQGARRVFLDGGRPVRSLLTVLSTPDARHARFRNEILSRFDAQRPHASGRDEPVLTQSELAVLRFLPSHMTNPEIAAELFLSVNTVKTHLRSIYRKLGVRSRREAISQARRAGLV